MPCSTCGRLVLIRLPASGSERGLSGPCGAWGGLDLGRCEYLQRMGTLRGPVVIGGFRRGRHSPTRIFSGKLKPARGKVLPRELEKGTRLWLETMARILRRPLGLKDSSPVGSQIKPPRPA